MKLIIPLIAVLLFSLILLTLNVQRNRYFPIISITGTGVTTEVRLAHLGRYNKFTLREGDWVEIVDDNYTLNNNAGKLLKVAVIDRDEMSVTVDGTTEIRADAGSKNHALLRCWDQKPVNSDDRDLVLHRLLPDSGAHGNRRHRMGARRER